MAEDKVLIMLNEEIADQLTAIGKEELNTKDMAERIKNVTELYKLRIEEMKLAADIEDKSAKRSIDVENNIRSSLYKDEELKGQKKDRRIKVGLAVGQGVLYVGAFLVGLNFEKTGSFSSKMMTNLIGKFRLSK